jgi:RimJ/RimL family protein N-acetyltransferase
VVVLETERLVLRHLAADDAPFIVELLNDPDWLRFIGDRGVRTAAQGAAYIESGPARMYARHGFGLYLTELRDGGAPIGLCGLVKRDFLEDVDLGFAFLPRFRGAGYAREAAAAVLRYAGSALGLRRVAAITTADNERSAQLLGALGFRFERMVAYEGDGEPLRLFARSLEGAGGAAPQS